MKSSIIVGIGALLFIAVSSSAVAANLSVTLGSGIYLVNESVAGGFVNFAGTPVAGGVGSGSDVGWDPITGDLVALAGTGIWRNHGSGWLQTVMLPVNIDSAADISISRTGRIAATLGNFIYLINESVSGGFVNFAGTPIAGGVGSASDIDWDPSTGELVALAGSAIWRNNGSGWLKTVQLPVNTDNSSDIAISRTGRIAATLGSGGIYLINEAVPGGLVDFAGAPTNGAVGSGSDIDWDPITGELVAIAGTGIWRNHGSGWLQTVVLAGNTDNNCNIAILQGYNVAVPGDFNSNGAVDVADYVVWRKGLGTTYTQSDYNTWRSHFGQTTGSGAIASAAVPEPATVVLLIVAVASSYCRRGWAR